MTTARTPFSARQFSIIVGMLVSFTVLEFVLFQWVDRPIARSMFELQSTDPSIFSFFQTITDLGKAQWYLWPCGVLTVICTLLSRGKDVPQRYRRLFGYTSVRCLFLFCTLSLSGIVADIIKPIMGRARPILWINENMYGFYLFTTKSSWNSFPSGHTTTAFALGFSLITLYPRLRSLWLGIAILLGVSRIMVDAHYLSDVIAGAILGWLTVKLFIRYAIMHVWRVMFPLERPFGPM